MGALQGKRIVLTKAHRERDDIREALQKEGAEVLEIPLIEVSWDYEEDKCAEVLDGIARYAWIAFSSVNGVKYFFKTFFHRFSDIRAIGPARIACVGDQTAQELDLYHLQIDVVPEQSNGVALAQALVDTESLPSDYVLWVSGDKPNQEAIDLVEGKGEAITDVFQVYKSEIREMGGDPVVDDFKQNGADAIFFASPSAAESFVKQAAALQMADGARYPKTVSIGATTSEGMKTQGIPVDKECKQPNPKEIVSAIAALLGKR